MPGTPDTLRPLSGETWAAPWMSWMRVAAPVAVVKLQESSAAMASGGSSVSWSVTWAASTVTVQGSPGANSAAGSSVNVVGPPLEVAGWAPLVAHEIENQDPDTSTGSLNAIVTDASTGTSAAPAAGVREAIAGAASPPH